MATVNIDNMLTRLRQKRAIMKRRKIIVCTIISFMVTLVQWYYDNFRVKEPSHDWDEERRSYLNRMYNGKEVDCIDQFRISKSAFKRFIYVLPGWEGSASDARILRDALRRNNRFHVARDKYYLVDAGYTNGPGFLAPYRGTRYHLSEWSGNNRPENYKELFNLRHSIAMNVVERGFGLLKKRWSILRTPGE